MITTKPPPYAVGARSGAALGNLRGPRPYAARALTRTRWRTGMRTEKSGPVPVPVPVHVCVCVCVCACVC